MAEQKGQAFGVVCPMRGNGGRVRQIGGVATRAAEAGTGRRPADGPDGRLGTGAGGRRRSELESVVVSRCRLAQMDAAKIVKATAH